MNEPIINKITDPNAGQVEVLIEAQLLINQRDAYKLALELACGKLLEVGMTSWAVPQEWYDMALTQLEMEKINSGKVA